MAHQTILDQDCLAALNAQGVVKFRINTSVAEVKVGDLPFPDVFVHQVVINNDPKSDKFLRVSSIVDLTTLPRGRDAALNAKSKNYLTSSFLVEFDDVTTATAAKKLIAARVDQLVLDWIKYNNEFVNPELTNIPVVPSSIVTTAKNDYKQAKNTRVAAEADLAAKDAALTTALAAASAAAQKLTDATAASIGCTQNLALLSSAQSAINTFLAPSGTADGLVGSSKTFVEQAYTFESANDGTENTVTTFEGQISGYESVLNSFNGALTTVRQSGLASLTAAYNAISLECTNAQGAVTTAATEKTNADTAAATAQTNKTLAEAAVTAAKAVEATARTHLEQVCPDYDFTAA